MGKQKKIMLICIAALCAALSIILGKVFAFTLVTLRISFESLPIILCSLLLGPVAGMSAGLIADLVGCLLVGYTINPIITLGCALMGLFPWLIKKYVSGKKGIFISVIASHFICSVGIKTVGLLYYYGGGFPVVLTRLVTYIAISAVESYLVYLVYTALGKRIIKK
ncbi:MAG: folate family ECF transporter S component [Oscillospiraceae bacterium]|nr:folate family ECF transporter S component [Oscillospiraceae bacterium]